MDTEAHRAITGGSPPIIHLEEGEPLTAYDACLWSKNLELIPKKNSAEPALYWFQGCRPGFDRGGDFKKQAGGTVLSLTHCKVPNQEEHVKQGCVDHYFKPVTIYLGMKSSG